MKGLVDDLQQISLSIAGCIYESIYENKESNLTFSK
jgi:hypothetical protein